MKLFFLDKNTIREVTLDSIPRDTLVWIRAISPDKEELDALFAVSNIPKAELQESVEEEERPRLLQKKYIELIYDAPHTFQKEGLQTMEVYVYISGNLLITIEEEPNRILNRIEQRCRKNNGKFLFRSHGKFLYHILDDINDEFIVSMERVSRNVGSPKRAETETDISELSAANAAFAYFNQAIIANLEVLNQLRKCHHKAFTGTDRESFNELYFDKLQILDTEKVQRELIMNKIHIQSIVSTEKLNQTMKRLTAMALLVMVPTFVTGLYGMNVSLPFMEHAHAFAILAGGMLALSLTLLFVMRKLDWI